jgi:superfamily I DNA and RNA helicase
MRNDLIELESADSDTIRERFKQAFDPWWPFGKLTPGQINVLRSVIHPEIVIAPPPSNAELATQPVTADLKVLDMRQERNARSIGDGHRVIYGVAGSGKTVLLIARAKLIAEDNSKQVLVLCFNKALAFYFQRVFKNTPNIRAQHFHAWGDRQSVRFVKDEDVADFGGRLLERLKRGEGDAGCYDAVLIDEVQDFDLTWLACAKLALKEPEDGDLMVVGDGDQSLYERRPFTWKDAGIAAIGRTTILRKNYRNTRQVLLCAQPFTSPTSTTYHGRGATNFAVAVNPAAAVRTGPWPEILAADSIYAECDIVVKHVRDWLTQGYTSSDGRRIKLQPTDITILYPYMPRQREQAMEYLLSKLRELTKTSWLKALGNDPARIPPGNLIVRTILSFKGLQNTAVIVMWSDLLPHWNDVDLDRGQFYVALTRAEDVLLVTRSGESEFTRQIESALAEARRGEA